MIFTQYLIKFLQNIGNISKKISKTNSNFRDQTSFKIVWMNGIAIAVDEFNSPIEWIKLTCTRINYAGL